MRVKYIKIENSATDSRLEGLLGFNNRRIFLLTPNVIENKIRQDNPTIKKAIARIIYPDTLSIFVSYYEPLVVLKSDNGFYSLSEDGIILNKTRDKPNLDLPILEYYQAIQYSNTKVGDKINYKDILMVLSVIVSSKNINFQIDSIDIRGENMIVCKVKDREIIFTTERDKDRQLYEYAAVVKQFKIQGKDFKSLDLRFSKPVVLF